MAQKRSELELWLASTCRLSTVTTSADWTLSHAAPYFGIKVPIPPPSVRPPISHSRASPHNSSEAKALCRLVYVACQGPCLCRNCAFSRLDGDSPHSRKIDYHPVITHSESSGAMPTTTHRHGQTLA